MSMVEALPLPFNMKAAGLISNSSNIGIMRDSIE